MGDNFEFVGSDGWVVDQALEGIEYGIEEFVSNYGKEAKGNTIGWGQSDHSR